MRRGRFVPARRRPEGTFDAVDARRRGVLERTPVTIGVVCAIPQEWAYLRGMLSGDEPERLAGVSFDTGDLDGHPIVLAAAGMGKVNVALVATLLADRFHCRTIVFTGVAGGLDPRLDIGDIVIADRVVQHDFGVIEEQRLRPYQPGHIPFINPTEQFGYAVAPALLERIKQRLAGFTLPALPQAAGGTGTPARITYGTVLTGDQYLHCASTRNRLHDEFKALAIEMEGGALAQVCEAFAIPWLVIRALSDLAGTDSGVDFNAFAEQVALSSARVLLHLLPTLG